MIEFQCTNCSQRIKTKDQFAGKPCKCPKCSTPNTIPSIAEVPSGPDQYEPKPTVHYDFNQSESNQTDFEQPQAPPAPDTHQPDVQYAGFWKRFCAIFIDGLIVGLTAAVIGGFVGGILGGILGASGADPEIIQIFAGIAGVIIAFLTRLFYYSLMESSSLQATVGKMALGIIVTDYSGNRITFLRAMGRFFAKIVSALILYIGFMMAGFTEKKQGLHDMIASTYVINKNP